MKRVMKISGLVLVAAVILGIFLNRSSYKAPVSPPAYESDAYSKSKDAVMLQELGYVSDAGEQNKVPSKSTVERKVIQHGFVSIQIKNYDQFYQELLKQLSNEGGFVSNLEANRHSGRLVSAQIVVRIPSNRTNVMVSWLHEKGEIISEKITAEDVSEEYYDTQARLGNARNLESRLIEMVKTHTGRLQDLILLEEKIGEIRGQIEQMEARIRILNRLISLATLTINVQVGSITIVQPPTFATRIKQTWSESTDALTDFLKSSTLVFVRAIPWIPVFLLITGGILIVYRMALRLLRKRTPVMNHRS